MFHPNGGMLLDTFNSLLIIIFLPLYTYNKNKPKIIVLGLTILSK